MSNLLLTLAKLGYIIAIVGKKTKTQEHKAFRCLDRASWRAVVTYGALAEPGKQYVAYVRGCRGAYALLPSDLNGS